MGRQNTSVLTLSVKATAALTNETFVGPTGAVAVAAGNALGVTRSDAAIGEFAPVDALGTTMVTAGAAIAAGAAVEVGAAGRAVTKAAGVAVGRLAPDSVAAANGDRVEIILIAN